MISGRDARKRPKPRRAGEIADRGDLSKGIESGAKWASIGHETPCFAPPPLCPARRKPRVFSENLAMRRRFARAARAAI